MCTFRFVIILSLRALPNNLLIDSDGENVNDFHENLLQSIQAANIIFSEIFFRRDKISEKKP